MFPEGCALRAVCFLQIFFTFALIICLHVILSFSPFLFTLCGTFASKCKWWSCTLIYQVEPITYTWPIISVQLIFVECVNKWMVGAPQRAGLPRPGSGQSLYSCSHHPTSTSQLCSRSHPHYSVWATEGYILSLLSYSFLPQLMRLLGEAGHYELKTQLSLSHYPQPLLNPTVNQVGDSCPRQITGRA